MIYIGQRIMHLRNGRMKGKKEKRKNTERTREEGEFAMIRITTGYWRRKNPG